MDNDSPDIPPLAQRLFDEVEAQTALYAQLATAVRLHDITPGIFRILEEERLKFPPHPIQLERAEMGLLIERVLRRLGKTKDPIEKAIEYYKGATFLP